MKRSAIVVLILVAGVTAMIWSGLMAYRMRKAMNTPPAAQDRIAGATQVSGRAFAEFGKYCRDDRQSG